MSKTNQKKTGGNLTLNDVITEKNEIVSNNSSSISKEVENLIKNVELMETSFVELLEKLDQVICYEIYDPNMVYQEKKEKLSEKHIGGSYLTKVIWRSNRSLELLIDSLNDLKRVINV